MPAMAEPQRIGAQDVRNKLLAGEPTLLVCAYDQPDALSRVGLEGAIGLSTFQERVGSLSKDQEIVFY